MGLKYTQLLIILGLTALLCQLSLAQKVSTQDSLLKTEQLQEVVILGTKQAERLLESPVSIETFDYKSSRQSAQPGFFEAIQNVKGLNVITPSLGFRVINARGFANTTNVRFVQMVDGMDIQIPSIGAPIANTIGPSDLDINNLEIIPGSASAIYGMNAINGIANFMTKDPFQFQGLSFSQKSGMNNVNNPNTTSTYFNETSIRYAKAFSRKFAIKFNGTFTTGIDWYANNKTDLNPNANISSGLVGEQNPGSDLVNLYGDESSDRKTLTLGGKQYVVSRTGYAEKDVADYSLKNLKGDVGLFFRPRADIEISYVYRFSEQNNIYQRTNRFRFNDYITQQHGVSFKSNSIQFKAYLNIEDSGNSYNIRSMAENINRSFKSDVSWFSDFSNQYNAQIQNGLSVADAMAQARVAADNGRYQPGSTAIQNEISRLSGINNWDIGAALRVKANMFHAEFQHELTNKLLKNWKDKYHLSVLYGFDFRNYNIYPDGNYFINPTEPGQNLNYWKTGGFIQLTKTILNEKIKINGVLRIDKNQYFEPKFNPRLAIVFNPLANHSIRVSIQNGFRFPSIFEAFSNINSGGRKRVGGLPIMSNGIFENSYTQSSTSAFQSAVQNDVNKNGLSLPDAISREQGLLQKNSYTYVQPEQITAFEIGYRTELLDKKLNIDVDFYFNIYTNLIAQIDANVPKTSNPDSLSIKLQNNSTQDLYRLWTNSKTISNNYGGTLGISYQLPRNFIIGGKLTYAKLESRSQRDGLEDGFNTPEWSYSVSIGNNNIFKRLGFNINFRQQASYLWESALATGTVASYSTWDAQINVNLLKNYMNLKIGATNLLNQYYYSFIGSPAIGGLYYINLSLDLGKKE